MRVSRGYTNSDNFSSKRSLECVACLSLELSQGKVNMWFSWRGRVHTLCLQFNSFVRDSRLGGKNNRFICPIWVVREHDIAACSKFQVTDIKYGEPWTKNYANCAEQMEYSWVSESAWSISQFSKSFRYYNFVLILCNILFLDFPYQPRTQKNSINYHCID